jgi:predicted dehydrogenase
VGERGALVADFAASTVTLHVGEHRRRGEAWEAVDEGKEELTASGPEPLRLELEAFLTACRGSGPNPVPAEAGLRALQIAEAASRAARLERTVSIAEIA